MTYPQFFIFGLFVIAKTNHKAQKSYEVPQ